MKWNETNYPRIGETVLRTTLPNGLTVAVVPKPLYRKRYAFFTTRYGGMDMRFRLDGVWHDTPAGIAHYLEHKMFDTEDGNALQVLSQNGAEPNAFTSNATTAYYFDCTEHFEENLRILLSFVSVPYFTQESVDKERGIIGQEIRMVEDTPDWRVYTNLLECLYHSSPARVAIAGTVESIAEITPETLYACHKAFYDPANMMLCVVGDVKPDEIAAIAEEILPNSRGEVIERDYGQEDMRVVEKCRREAMEVSMPQFLVGFKCPPAADGSIDWAETYRIWDGGLAIYGAVIAAFLTAWLVCRKKQLSLWALADCCVAGFFIGQAIGRWGNFFNREAFGGMTELPWRMRLWISGTYYIDVHPTFLYESLWNVAGLLLLCLAVDKVRRFDGENTCFYFLWYGIGRFWIEGLRTDSLYLFHVTLFGERVRVSQALSLVMIVLTAVILLKNRSADPARMFVNRRLDGQATVLPDRSEERPIADGPAEADRPAKAPAEGAAGGEASAEGAAEPADGGDNG